MVEKIALMALARVEPVHVKFMSTLQQTQGQKASSLGCNGAYFVNDRHARFAF